MNKQAKKTLLFLLSIVMFFKRVLVGFFQLVGKGFIRVNGLYEKTIGPTLYQWFYTLQKNIRWISMLKTSGLLGFFGRRSVLQIVLFLTLCIIMVPQTKLYTAERATQPGQNTLLYRLVGPGEQDFSLDELTVEQAVPVFEETDRSWRDGAISADQQNALSQLPPVIDDIAAISVGGTAVTKPTILPGNQLPTQQDSSMSQGESRKSVIEYTVESGDTIGAIAEAFHISQATILWANDLTTRSFIRPGDTLKILPTDGLIHTVARGDTVSSLANTYDTESSKIIAFNNLQKDGSDIIVGETLIIPDGIKPVPKSTYTVPQSRPYTPLTNVAAPPPSISAPAGSGYLWPLGAHVITQYYGFQHTGLDISGGGTGTPIYASRGGTVKISQCGYNGGYGCYIILDHGDGVNTLYGHASQLYVSAGETIIQGQTIAAMGNTGRSTGPHLHFEVRINGVRTNPLKYIRY
ncbi:MAG: hypothetical protein CO029_02685 [Candidatus Magasanikbacteria bacterium CG_4_9_14_0_2_um_filter_41_10]|uniref:LysM domain-containing protein n=1 Tax=Candidatus Magasanikbacteria bacterium CG_4_10_14_0_2_um_filter_41_31 TaxID=1974639 RepID=A0A2M7V2Y5_9BACT|nr:MAG: hypothetical protein AUJ37_03810 [Candidatus Magasanikbacteria bacterium CG1_02_41_34]PIZ92823.1 MAG: hypothetical protein COX83_03495 [Candidatus Magasanikbacteria bacterium CG_4_10_14_0_2_um_filter_41_31]PJC53441.1 MAG: hypothetical protein CO029_02685 [Candidatus Magasanikbacteria bacterium CG_4_9_14_0_2_um_filter_41_10]